MNGDGGMEGGTMATDDAARAWLSSIGPGQHEFAKLRALWIGAGNAAVSDVQLGRWLTAAGFARSRRGKSKTTHYARVAKKVDAKRTRTPAQVVAEIAPQTTPPVDVVAASERVVAPRPQYTGARLLAWRFARQLPDDAINFVEIAVEFSYWLDAAGLDAVDGAVLAGWLAEDGRAVDAVSFRRAA